MKGLKPGETYLWHAAPGHSRGRPVRGRQHGRQSGAVPLSGRRTGVANRRAACRQYFPHLADGIRMLRKAGPDEPAKDNYQFKHMTTVGEPIEPRSSGAGITRSWARARPSSLDTWWQTETGGFLLHDEVRPGPDEARSARPPALGIFPIIHRRKRPGGRRRFGQSGQHLHPESLAGHHADGLGGQGPLREAGTMRSTARTRRAKTGAIGRTLRRTAR